MKCPYCGGKTTEPICVCCGKILCGQPASLVAPKIPSVASDEKTQERKKMKEMKLPQSNISKEAMAAAPTLANTRKKQRKDGPAAPNAGRLVKEKTAQKGTGAGKSVTKPAAAATVKTAPSAPKKNNNKNAGQAKAGGGKAFIQQEMWEDRQAGAELAAENTASVLPAAEEGDLFSYISALRTPPKLKSGLLVFYIWECLQMLVGGVVLLFSGIVTVAHFISIAIDAFLGENTSEFLLREGMFANLLLLVLLLLVSLYYYKINQAVVDRIRNRQISFLVPYYIFTVLNIFLAFLCYYIYYSSASVLFFTIYSDIVVYPTIFFALNAAISVAWVVYLFTTPRVAEACGGGEQEKEKKQQRG